ncbi:putative pentatricopeptide repeat-containing protein At5g06400, mitochondrial [Pistacia vera]|uniref:putative pentatricopeptide repeat-containing protein At5g06400, mitochondrial n=1 Tax=Pistacia vera TaxID=55513 RepID=UPI0012632486|nr:putative pentatricopeptide repeat-containing protein At5g06400, mitochondrial [Pistacia vera]
MVYLARFKFLYSNSSCKLRKSELCRVWISRLSTFSKSSKPSQTKNAQHHPPKGQTEKISSLFNEITEILGADNVVPDETPFGLSISRETEEKASRVSENFDSCLPSVCGNAQEEKFSVLGDTQMGNLSEIDVSPVVHEITEIVRAEKCVVSLEERLGNLGFRFDPKVVEKVLKRCFKVPNLALRFFNWVTVREGFHHTSEIYNTMLSIAGEAKEFGLMEELVKEMEMNSCEKSIKTWTILVSQYGKAKLIGKALLVFDNMKKCGFEPDVSAYKIMIRSLCNAGKGDIALEFYKEVAQKEMLLDLNLYKMVMNCAARLGDVDVVHSVANDMIKISQIPEHDVYVHMLKSFCASGRIKEALELIQDLKSKEVSIDDDYFKTLVEGLCRAGRISDALEIVDIMKKRDLVDGKVYGFIISGHLRKNDLSKALVLFQEMKESDYLPLASTYTELMQCLFKLNEYQKGCELYDEMLQGGVQPDSVAITAMVAGHVRQNHISEAWKAFESMKDYGIRTTWKSYSVFIKELCRVSRTDEIFKVLNKMQDSKIAIGDEIFHWVISCMERRGEMDNVEKVKQLQRISKLHSQGEFSSNETCRRQELHVELNHNQIEQEKMNSVLVKPPSKAYGEQDLKEICKILSSSTNWCFVQEALEKCAVQFTPELILEILRKCETNGNTALQFFSWVGKQAGYHHSTETYNLAIKIAGRGKDFKHMRNLFFEMRRKRYIISPDTWTIMIMQYGRAGLTEIALRVFGEMKGNGCNPTGSTYKYLVILLCGRKGRKVDDAVKIFQEMIHAGYIPDKELIETYLGCLSEVSKLQAARSCIDSLCKVGFTRPLSYSLYVRALCRAGRLEEALALLDEVEEDRPKLDQYIYGSVVHGLLRRGQTEEALAKVESMKQVGVYPTVHVYTSLIVHFFKEKQIERALETFAEMQEQGCEPTVVTYSALIRGYVNVGKVIEAWNVFNHMKTKGPYPDFKTYSMFISCLCKVGKSEKALQLISEMLDSGIVPSNINFRTIFFGLNREGKQDLARSVLHKKSALIRSRKFLN